MIQKILKRFNAPAISRKWNCEQVFSIMARPNWDLVSHEKNASNCIVKGYAAITNKCNFQDARCLF